MLWTVRLITQRSKSSRVFFLSVCWIQEDFYRLQLYTQNCKGNKVVFPWPSQAEKTWIDLTKCFYNLLTSPLFYPFLRCLHMLRCQKIGLLRNFMWTFRKILKFKNGVSKYACTRVCLYQCKIYLAATSS